jgi:hypothetical protein
LVLRVAETMIRQNEISEMRTAVSGPEKAGVGGSTPSLATIIPKGLRAFAGFLQPKVQPKIRH